MVIVVGEGGEPQVRDAEAMVDFAGSTGRLPAEGTHILGHIETA